MSTAIEFPAVPAVLAWARDSAGLSLDEAASRLRQTRAELLDLERGRRHPSLGEARDLASLYKRSMAALLLPSPPAEPAQPADFRAGAHQTLGPDTRLAIRRAERLQALAGDLFEALDNPSLWRRGSLGPQADPAEAAEEIRRQLPISIQEQSSWKHDYEALRRWRDALGATGALVLQMRMPVAEVRGFSLSTDGPVTIVLNGADGYLARVFTLFHELTHQLLGTGGICLPEPGQQSHGASQVAETFCNRVAGNLLVPSDVLKSDPDANRLGTAAGPSDATILSRLSRRYWASRQVVWYRLREEGFIDPDVYRSMWAIWSAQPMATSKVRRGGTPKISRSQRVMTERGPKFVASVFEAHDRGMLGLSDAMDFLEVGSKDMAKLEGLITSARA